MRRWLIVVLMLPLWLGTHLLTADRAVTEQQAPAVVAVAAAEAAADSGVEAAVKTQVQMQTQASEEVSATTDGVAHDAPEALSVWAQTLALAPGRQHRGLFAWVKLPQPVLAGLQRPPRA